VTLPDWQGLGLAFVLSDALGAAYKRSGMRFHTYPAHPALIHGYDRSPMYVDDVAARRRARDAARGTTSSTPRGGSSVVARTPSSSTSARPLSATTGCTTTRARAD
jgi:hypothetical protein